jgi:uncharacterized membrane protein
MYFEVVIVLIILLAIDGVYLSLTSSPFIKMIEQVQHGQVTIRWSGAVVSYVCMALLLYLFAIQKQTTFLETFLLGFLAYGIYDSVNYALLSKWNGWIAIQDSIWGGVLFMVAKWVYQYFMR